MKFYMVPLAPNPVKVMLYMAERRALGVSFGIENVIINTHKGIHKMPEHVSRNPFGTLPVLETLVAYMIATLDENRMGDDVIFDAGKFKTQAVSVVQASSVLAELDQTVVDVNLVMQLDVSNAPAPAAAAVNFMQGNGGGADGGQRVGGGGSGGNADKSKQEAWKAKVLAAKTIRTVRNSI